MRYLHHKTQEAEASLLAGVFRPATTQLGAAARVI